LSSKPAVINVETVVVKKYRSILVALIRKGKYDRQEESKSEIK
jgi:hypothetical protein